MNEFLAQMYGTAETIGSGDDTEKLAQAQVMNEMFAAEGIDVDSLAPETIVKVAEALFGENTKIAEEDVKKEDDDEEEEKEEEKEEEEEKKEAEEKLAEADFLGRVMAHSYVNEMAEIEKQAGVLDKGVAAGRKALGWVGGKTMSTAAKGEHASRGAEMAAQRQAARSGSAAAESAAADRVGARGLGTKASRARGQEAYESAHRSTLNAPTAAEKRVRERAASSALGKAQQRRGAKVVGGTALGLGALGTGAALMSGEKKASALDALAEKRAMEILAENGYEFEPSGEEKLASAVEERAYQMLAEAGYISEE